MELGEVEENAVTLHTYSVETDVLVGLVHLHGSNTHPVSLFVFVDDCRIFVAERKRTLVDP